MTNTKQARKWYFSTAFAVAALGAATMQTTAYAQEAITRTNITPLPTASDLVGGQDKPGPYQLTWKKLPPAEMFPLQVVVDEKTLTPDAYRFDAEKGTITFNEPLKTASMARIVFSYDPESSERNAAPAAAPITVPLMKAGSTQLQLTALTGAKGKQDGDALLVMRLDGAPMNALGGRVTTQALLAPDAGKEGDEKGTSLWERSGLNVGYLMGSDVSGLEARYTRGGRSFAGTAGKSFQMRDTAGDSRFLAARYAVAPWLRAEWKQDDANLLEGNVSGTTAQTMSLRLGGMKNQPMLNLERSANDSTGKDGVTSGKTRDKLELQAKIGTQVAFGGTAETATTEKDNKPGEKTTNLALNVSAQSSNKSQKAEVALTDTNKVTDAQTESKNGVAITLQASPSVTLSASQNSQEVSTTPKNGAGETTQKEQIKAEATIAFAPGASLTGGVAKDSSAKVDNKTDLQAATITAKIGEGKGIELSQTVITRAGSATGTATLDTTDTRLSLRPVRGLTLSGALINNPVKDGRVTDVSRQELGLKAKIGAMELGSGYALNELGTQEGWQTGEFSVSLGLRFNQYTRFVGEFKDGLFWGGADGVDTTVRGMRVYSLGLTHALSSSLNFTLGGDLQQDKAGGIAPDQYEVKANLGVKF